jgi:hypothetical protein
LAEAAAAAAAACLADLCAAEPAAAAWLAYRPAAIEALMRLATCRTGGGGDGGVVVIDKGRRSLRATAGARERHSGAGAELEAGRLAALACLLEVAGRPERARRLHAMRAGGDAAFPTVFAAAAALIAGTASDRSSRPLCAPRPPARASRDSAPRAARLRNDMRSG